MAVPFNKMYYFLNPGNTTLQVTHTSTASVVNNYIKKIQNLLEETGDKIVGLNVECTNKQSSTQKAAIIQICVGIDCLVCRICLADQPCSKLAELLAKPNISFVGVDIGNNGIRIRRSLVPVTNFLDTHKRSKPAGSMNEKDSLTNYVVALIYIRYKVIKKKKKKKKDVDHKQWGNMPLTGEQIQYASLDAYVTYEVYRQIVNFERGQQTLKMFNKNKN